MTEEPKEVVVEVPEDAVDFACAIEGEGPEVYHISYEYNGVEGLLADVPKSKVYSKTDHGLVIDNATITQIQTNSSAAE